MYFSEQGNVDDDATFITIFLVSFNLQSCCLMQSAVCKCHTTRKNKQTNKQTTTHNAITWSHLLYLPAKWNKIIDKQWSSDAKDNGVSSLKSGRCRSPPFMSSNLRQLACPFQAARWTGVLPSLGSGTFGFPSDQLSIIFRHS